MPSSRRLYNTSANRMVHAPEKSEFHMSSSVTCVSWMNRHHREYSWSLPSLTSARITPSSTFLTVISSPPRNGSIRTSICFAWDVAVGVQSLLRNQGTHVSLLHGHARPSFLGSDTTKDRFKSTYFLSDGPPPAGAFRSKSHSRTHTRAYSQPVTTLSPAVPETSALPSSLSHPMNAINLTQPNASQISATVTPGPSRHPHFTAHVLELVKLLQAALAICGMFPLPPPHTPAAAFDGLLCDVTIDGLRRWGAEIGDSLIGSEVSSYLHRYCAYRANTHLGTVDRACRRSQCDCCAFIVRSFNTQQACSLATNRHQRPLSSSTRVPKCFIVLCALCEQWWHTDANPNHVRANRELEYRAWKRKHFACHAIHSCNDTIVDELSLDDQPPRDASSDQRSFSSRAYPRHLPHARLAQVVAFPT